MTRRDWLALSALVLAVVVVAATVAVVLHDRSGHRSAEHLTPRQLNLCTNPGNGGC